MILKKNYLLRVDLQFPQYIILSVSKRVNVYGWDFYFDKKIKEYNFLSFLKNIYKLGHDTKIAGSH